MKTVKIASSQPFYVDNNPQQVVELIINQSQEADKDDVKLICFPECFLQGYEINSKTPDLGIDLSSLEFSNILDKLKKIRTCIVFGLIERDKGNTFNTAVVVERGKLLGKYRKSKLIGSENNIFLAGEDYPVFETQNLKFGINICYDLNFSECAKAVADKGAKLLVCPSNNMLERDTAEKWKDKHNPSRIQRALETGLWLISSDVTGKFKGKVGFGPTAIISPKGEVVDQLPTMEEGLLIYDILLQQFRE